MSSNRHTYLQVIYFIHLIFGGILLYAAILHFQQKPVPRIVYSLLMLLGFAAIGYHGYWLLDSLYREHSD